VRPSRLSHLVHPLPSRTNNVGQTMQFGDNYLNDGYLPPEIPQIDGRDSFNSVSQRSLAVRPLKCPTGRPRRSCAAVVTSRVTCVWWQVRRRHQMTVVPACDSPRSQRRRPWRSAAEMCGRRTHPPADADPQEFLRSADWCGRLTQARHSASWPAEHSEQML